MKTIFVVLNWQSIYFEDMTLVATEEGKVQVFTSHKEAERYAEENLNFNWKIVEIEISVFCTP